MDNAGVKTLGEYLVHLFSDAYLHSTPSPRFRSRDHPIDGKSQARDYYVDREAITPVSQELKVIPICPQTDKPMEAVTLFKINRLNDRVVA